MMRISFFLIALATAFSSEAQRIDSLGEKQRKFYGQVGPMVNTESKFGAGFSLGYRFAREVGAGIGAEVYRIDTFKNSTPAAPVFAEIRYFVPTKFIEPFVALQGGYLFWNRQETIRIYNSSTNFDFKAKHFFGGNIGFKIPLGENTASVFFSASYRNYVLATGTEKKVRVYPTPTTSYYETQWDYKNSQEGYWVFSVGVAW